MTEADFLALLDRLGARCAVRASELLEDHHEVEIGDTLMYLQWREEDATIALTVPLPEVDLGDNTPGALASRYRLVLQRQWQQSSEDGVYFGVLPITAELVGMVALAGETVEDPDVLHDELTSTLVAVETAWYEITAQWLTDSALAQPPADALPAAAGSVVRA
jgi:hypothetical protein